MKKTVLNVEGMSCDHCVSSIKNTLSAIGGIGAIDVDLEKKTVSFEHEETVSLDNVRSEIEDIGYDVV